MKCPICGEVIVFGYPGFRKDIPNKAGVVCEGCHAFLDDVAVLSDSEYPNISVVAPDMVNHPPHYQSETGLEAIDVIEAFTFDLKGIEAFCTGNALKYLCRWKQKDGLKDLKKAGWYINRLIKHIEKLEKENDQS